MDLEILHLIDEELSTEEVDALKFLCMDVLSRKRLEAVKDAKDLFLRLYEQDKFNDEHFLSVLLYTIGRYDLLLILGTSKQNVKHILQTQNKASVTAYRQMLYKLSEEVTDEHLRNIKFLLNDMPKSKLEHATFLDIMAEMEKKERLGEENLDLLESILDKCSKGLSSIVQRFKEMNGTKRPEQISTSEEFVPISESYPQQYENEFWSMNTSIMESNHHHHHESFERMPLRVVTDSEIPNTNEPLQNTIDENDFYPMNHRPLGYCLIINNYDFNGTSLSNRKGTDMDRDTLTRVFERMNFLVEERRDLPSEKIEDVVRKFSEKDHSEMDAFVCCILSHGEKGSVFGVNGVTVSIRDLTEPFALCQTLMGKPKLFFIQACQGDELQRGVWMGDGASEDKQMYVDDAQKSGLNSIPIKADFLIGMATVEYYKSFRHTAEGSIYIQELCKQLEIGCPRNEDILSILTKVNASVSTKVLSGHKQMPEPRYTLTKKLVLPMD
ncbi:caspase-8 [Trichomycterus rosablanca]|uniref:caspase-8 n=1 Tax=Trichomycterus rosablanca TaxID=2290929 RepID=UPI002F35914F